MTDAELRLRVPPRPAAASWAEHVRRTVGLALPVIVARSGVLIMIAVDTAMTGRTGAQELAFLSLGMAMTVTLMLVGLGLLLGTSVLVSQADGAGAQSDCGAIWRVSLVHAAVLGLIMMGLCQFGESFLLAIGQDPVLAEGGGRVTRMFGWGLPGIFFYLSTVYTLEGIGRPVPGMIIMMAANVVNFGLNWLVLSGSFGSGLHGAEGIMFATTVTRWLTVAAAVAYVLTMADGERYGIWTWRSHFAIIGAKLRHLGYPMALAQGLEMAAIMSLMLMAGYLGPTALGGYQIGQNLFALVFMTAIGIAAASGIRVANAVGRGDPQGIRRAGWVGVGLCGVVMGGFGIIFLTVPGLLAAIYTDDAEVLGFAVRALIVAAFVVVVDGVQVVLVQALRGTGDVWAPMGLQIAAFWILGVPAGAWLAFQAGLGVQGLMGGILVGAAVSSLANGWRFAIVSRRSIRPL